MKKQSHSFFILVVAILFVIPVMVFAVDLQRPYDPVVIQGGDIAPFLGAPVHDVFVYRSRNGVWEQIPFQIDERDGKSYFGSKNGFLNTDDEICFMASDAGDVVTSGVWGPDDLSAQGFVRIPVFVTNNSVSPPVQAAVYIFRSSTLSKTGASYMSYTAPTSGGNDAITGTSYLFGHDVNAIPTELRILSAVGGSGVDILDRWKIRYGGLLFNMPSIPYDLNELSGLTYDSLRVKIGPVRILREAYFDITTVYGRLVGYPVSYLIEFYRYSSRIHLLPKNGLASEWGLRKMRHTIDFVSSVSGSMFYSENNTDIPVDGTPDTGMNTAVTYPGITWYMLHGTHGIVATVVDLPQIGYKQPTLYYKDNSTIDPADTGDLVSYGECGIDVSEDFSLTGIFDLLTMMYYLGPGHPTAIGAALYQQFTNPLAVAVGAGKPVPVELAALDVKQNGGDMTLTWKTASETNNYGFEVQRRDEAQGEWMILTLIKGCGTSSDLHVYHYVDKDLDAGTYHYRLKQLDTDGRCAYSKEVGVTLQGALAFELDQNYPNPFNPSTEIRFQVPANYSGQTELIVYNLIGQVVRTLIEAELNAGQHRVLWDGRDDLGKEVNSGVYICMLKAGDVVFNRKMIKLQ